MSIEEREVEGVIFGPLLPDYSSQSLVKCPHRWWQVTGSAGTSKAGMEIKFSLYWIVSTKKRANWKLSGSMVKKKKEKISL